MNQIRSSDHSPTHTPVLLNEVLAAVKTMEQEPEWMLDGTFGRGGHCRALLSQHPRLRAIGLDRDAEAIEFGYQHFAHEVSSGRLKLLQANFHNVDQLMQTELSEWTRAGGFDVILLDLGVSSPQLDQATRGFSFYQDGPLDMRMDQRQDFCAADIINTWSESELVELFKDLGEVRSPYRVVKAILARRMEKSLQTTQALASLIESIEGWRKKGQHPATKYFLALRLEVNQELEGLKPALNQMLGLLRPGGRLLVISFHSLEDRIVKYCFREHKHWGQQTHKKVIQADRTEAQKNPRARSAKLRCFERQAQSQGGDL